MALDFNNFLDGAFNLGGEIPTLMETVQEKYAIAKLRRFQLGPAANNAATDRNKSASTTANSKPSRLDSRQWRSVSQKPASPPLPKTQRSNSPRPRPDQSLLAAPRLLRLHGPHLHQYPVTQTGLLPVPLPLVLAPLVGRRLPRAMPPTTTKATPCQKPVSSPSMEWHIELSSLELRMKVQYRTVGDGDGAGIIWASSNFLFANGILLACQTQSIPKVASVEFQKRGSRSGMVALRCSLNTFYEPICSRPLQSLFLC